MGDKQTWENDNGLVIRREPDGSVSFDIFDADEWNGGIEEGRTIAVLIVRAVNCHEELLELARRLIAISDGTAISPRFRHNTRAKAGRLAELEEQARAVIAKVEDEGHA